MQVLFKNKLTNLLGTELKVGDKFPDFKAVDNNLEDFDSKTIKGQRRLIFSIPSIDTGVCEMETTKFFHYFESKENPVVVISQDLPFALKRWCATKESEKVKTLSEFRHHDFANKTGTMLEGIGLLARACFVVDADDTILHVEYCANTHDEPNYKEIFKFFE
ncbi:thiol peroxidase [Mycoplasmopsis maculosa]|uniref:Thiol peroxidase n=1 Tax=Mycoplasmopsis maculosa TaxID=114885 RepID=A0A449B4H6_9BACT|nr:thiol peroxidase [Mycoplasmopsis maculosa]VEU75513.1 thiol peroxidase [Mycoplasmopsis maculosa]